jgi:hypothetical protein
MSVKKKSLVGWTSVVWKSYFKFSKVHGGEWQLEPRIIFKHKGGKGVDSEVKVRITIEEVK